MPRLKPHEKRDALLKRRAELDAQLKGIAAQEREASRKRDTRRKIVAGAIALEQIERDPTGAFAIQFAALLETFVEPRSRDLFPFLPASDNKAPESSKPKRPSSREGQQVQPSGPVA